MFLSLPFLPFLTFSFPISYFPFRILNPFIVQTIVTMSDQTVDARRVKKRELDRRAQRLARERNKTRIAQLEAMVQTLQQTDSNTRTAELMGQMNQVAEERDNLLQILRGLNQQIGSHIKRFATAPSSFDLGVTGPGSLPVGLGETNDTDLEVRQALPFDTSSVGDLIGSWGSEWNLFGDLPLDPTSQENPLITPGPSILHISPPLPSEDNLIKPLPSTPCPCTVSPPSPRGVFNTWRAANKALSRPTKLTRDDIVKEDLTSEDTPVRVMLQGWDSVEREGRMTASWRKLREVDEACFRNCDRVERLACMRIMHQLLTFHGWSTEERHGSLPSWLWVRYVTLSLVMTSAKSY